MSNTLIEYKELPFNIGDDVEFYYTLLHSDKIIMVRGTVRRTNKTTIVLSINQTKRRHFQEYYMRCWIFLDMEEAKKYLMQVFYKRIENTLNSIETISNLTEVTEVVG